MKRKSSVFLTTISVLVPIALLLFSQVPQQALAQSTGGSQPSSFTAGFSRCPVIFVYSPPPGATYPLTLYEGSNGSIAETPTSDLVVTIRLAQPLVGPISVTSCVTSPTTRDPQFGYATTQSAGWYGYQDSEYSDKTFLTANPNIGIGAGFHDNAASCMNGGRACWYHIGIGNNNGGTSCSNPPVVWGESDAYYNGQDHYSEYPLLCASYSTWYDNIVVIDSHGFWNYFVNQFLYATVLYSSGGNAISSSGTASFIEATSTPGQRTPTYSNGIYADALQYSKQVLPWGGNPSSLTWANPTSLTQYNNQWSTTYWSESSSHDSHYYWRIQYTWT